MQHNIAALPRKNYKTTQYRQTSLQRIGTQNSGVGGLTSYIYVYIYIYIYKKPERSSSNGFAVEIEDICSK